MKLITTLVCTLFLLQLHAQGGWDKSFLSDSMIIVSSAPTSDGGVVLLGVAQFIPTVLKVDALGNRQWVKRFTDIPYTGAPLSTGKIKITQDISGNYWFGISEILGIEATVVKLDGNGNRLFLKKIPIVGGETTAFGNELLIFGNISSIWSMIRLNTNGDIAETKSFPNFKSINTPPANTFTVLKNSFIFYGADDSTGRVQSIKMGFDGRFIAKNLMPTGIRYLSPLSPAIKTLDGGLFIFDSIGVKLDSFGRFQWNKRLNSLNQSLYGNRNLVAATTLDGGLLTVLNAVGTKRLYVYRYSKDGNLQMTNIWSYEGTLTLAAITRTSQGTFIMSGYTQGSKIRLIKLDEGGYFYPNFIKGNIFNDRDVNCLLSANDAPFPRVALQAKRAGFPDILAMSDSLGKYVLNVDVGTYSLNIFNPSRYTEVCTPSVSKTISTTNTLDSANFGIKTLISCPLMQVDITTARLRRCFNNNYTVNYCNKGTVSATGAYVNVTLDPLLEFVSAAKPLISITGRTYRFNLGDIAVNDCASFDIVARVRCGDSTRLGQTLCVEAKIYPDTSCVPDPTLWSGASLAVTGSCQGDSVAFEVKNTGTATSTATLSVIAENLSTTVVNVPALAVNAVFTKKYPANGNTWRLIVNQVPSHPRSFQPTAFVEGCRRTGVTTFATGFAAAFANDDAYNSIDIDCQPIIGAFDPNDKIGYPLGVGVNKNINQNQDIEYMIRFQNTGTDTAFTVVVRDTIDPNLDIFSIEWGASSHKYKPEIYGQNIVKFTFDNILLVDSFTNEPKSNGFLKFRIKQKKDVAFGTKIQNSAGIYFDFNDPVLTNKTLHTVSKDIVSGIIFPSSTTHGTIKVYPNPTAASAIFELKNGPLSITTFELYDIMGKRVRMEQFSGSSYEFHRQTLPTGVYLFKMIADGKMFGAGKLMIQ